MDIDSNDDSASGAREKPGSLVRAKDVLPGTIPILPQADRPFFPGQVIPLSIDPDLWNATIEHAQNHSNNIIGLLLTRTNRTEDTEVSDLAHMGTACRIHRVGKVDGRLQVLLEGIERFEISSWVNEKAPFSAHVSYFVEQRYEEDSEIKSYAIAITNTIRELIPLNPLYGEEFKLFLEHFHPNDPSHLADFAASLTTANKLEQQKVLDANDLLDRLQRVHILIIKELETAKTQADIRKQVEHELQDHQRESILREQMKVIQKELGISKDDRTADGEKFKARIEALSIPEVAQKRIDDEMQKFSFLETGSPEYSTTRNYLDWLTQLPWGVSTEDQLDLAQARIMLDEDHDGLDDIKQRIIEFIGVGIMKGEVSGSIILFVGPPGVGKTSLGRSVARALGRKFFRFSLGGMRDEAEIKGHRRTYVGAMPGKFIQAFKDTQSINPVIMLDEIDKVGASYHGDPASALLEVLDPEQNNDFLDHYLDVPFDLSKALFICTANQLDSIPAPLLDRMEVIRLSGYLASEKMEIARNHLIPRQLERNGLKKRGQLRIDKAALKKIVEDYAREAGVRRLEKYIGTIARKAVIKILENEKTPIHVRAKDVEEYLGKPIFTKEKPITGIGMITGLAWTTMGGVTLSIEATRIHSFNRGFKLTGQLGSVMKESAEIAYSYILANAEKWGASPDFFEKSLIHLHVPAGATPKDGPSAGITMACALLSLAKKKKPKRNLAMTGELTLTGQVLPVGGIREKVIAARRVNIKELILSEANRGDFEEIPEYIRKGVQVHFAEHFSEVAELVFA